MVERENRTRSINIILAALSVKEIGYKFNPVQMQKIVFLLEDRAGKELGIKGKFNFVPKSFGPFDIEVYNLLETASNHELVTILPCDDDIGYQRYILTEKGHIQGQITLSKMDENVCRFVNELVLWVVQCNFQDLIRAIYKAYPAMQENSMFG